MEKKEGGSPQGSFVLVRSQSYAPVQLKRACTLRIAVVEGLDFAFPQNTQFYASISIPILKRKVVTTTLSNTDIPVWHQRFLMTFHSHIEMTTYPLLVKIKEKTGKFTAREVASTKWEGLSHLKHGVAKDFWIDFKDRSERLHLNMRWTTEAVVASMNPFARSLPDMHIVVPLKTYHSGDTVRGVLNFSTTSAVKISKGLCVTLQAWESVRFTSGPESQQQRGKAVLYNKTMQLIDKANIAPGMYSLDFSIQIPTMAQSSFYVKSKGKRNANAAVVWKLIAFVDKYSESSPTCAAVEIQVLNLVDPKAYAKKYEYIDKKTQVRFLAVVDKAVIFTDDTPALQFQFECFNPKTEPVKINEIKLVTREIYTAKKPRATKKKFRDTLCRIKVNQTIKGFDSFKHGFYLDFAKYKDLWPSMLPDNLEHVSKRYWIHIKTEMHGQNIKVAFPMIVAGHPRSKVSASSASDDDSESSSSTSKSSQQEQVKLTALEMSDSDSLPSMVPLDGASVSSHQVNDGGGALRRSKFDKPDPQHQNVFEYDCNIVMSDIVDVNPFTKLCNPCYISL